MSYDSPDDDLSPYHYAKAYGLLTDEDDFDEFEFLDSHELMEVSWESIR